MVKWSGSEKKYPLSGDPGLLTRLWWAIEGWGRDLWWDFHALDRIDYIVFGLGLLLGLALALMILTLRFAP